MVILQHLKKFEKAKMQDFVDLFQGRLSRKQVRIIVSKLVENKELKKSGTGKGTYYDIGENYIKSMEVLSKALEIGLQQMEKNKD